jgi:3-methylornithine--L-lysine ligase
MRLLVVGGRLQGVEAAYLAKKAGFWVRVVDKKAPVPAMGLGDEFLQVDVTAPGGLAMAAEEIDLILPAMENQPALNALADGAPRLGIPFAFDPAAYGVSSSKQASDRLFAQHGIPAPIPWPVCGFPVVVKPSEGSGSEGVTFLADAAAQKILFGDSFPPENRIVQEHLQGRFFSVEVIGEPGNYQVLPTTELEMDTSHDCKRVLVPSHLTPAEDAQFAAIARTAAHAIQLKGIMDVEVIQHKGTLKVLEIDARLPSQTPIAVLHGSGLNQVAVLADLFAPGKPRSESPQGTQGSSEQATQGRGVILEHIQVDQGRLQVSGEHIMAVDQALQWVNPFFGADEALTTYTPGASTWVATVIMCGHDRKSAWEKRQAVMHNLKERLGLTALDDPSPEVPWLSEAST